MLNKDAYRFSVRDDTTFRISEEGSDSEAPEIVNYMVSISNRFDNNVSIAGVHIYDFSSEEIVPEQAQDLIGKRIIIPELRTMISNNSSDFSFSTVEGFGSAFIVSGDSANYSFALTGGITNVGDGRLAVEDDGTVIITGNSPDPDPDIPPQT